jgi:hypothetical protein
MDAKGEEFIANAECQAKMVPIIAIQAFQLATVVLLLESIERVAVAQMSYHITQKTLLMNLGK